MLSDPKFRQSVSDDLIESVNEWSIGHYQEGHRSHLGGSVIGEKCSRKLWYGFFWFKKEEFNGQKFRLFNRGHREEPAIIEFLTGIGCKFKYSADQQMRVSDVAGHFGGSLDNVGTLPPKYKVDEEVLFEFKTAAEKYFKELVKDGLKLAQPKHWSQICVYCYKADLKYCLYVSVNKNTDELYMELVEADLEMGRALIHKAEVIITSQEPMPKIAMSPTNWACKWCHFKDICHYGQSAEKNCRSCENSRPVENGEWRCDLHNAIIPIDFIPIGCQEWSQKGLGE